MNVAGSIAHTAINPVYYCHSEVSGAYFSLHLHYGKSLKILIPYSRFGTSYCNSFKTKNRIDVFCVDGEFYLTLFFLENVRNGMEVNQLDCTQETLNGILLSIQIVVK